MRESDEGELTEDEIFKDIEKAYRQLEKVREKLDKSYDIKLREKYMTPICNAMNILDYM